LRTLATYQPLSCNIQAVRPGMEILKLSAKTGEGMSEYLQFLERKRPRSRAAAAV
jgi:Ni2+-binding GTPase involved in maturation of urease and hydrogenase